jgi:hypothetical protein
MTESPAVFLHDFGVLATLGTASGKVIVDDQQQALPFGGFAGRSLTITFDPADFPTLDVGSDLVIDGKNYQVTSAPEGSLLHRCQIKVMP